MMNKISKYYDLVEFYFFWIKFLRKKNEFSNELNILKWKTKLNWKTKFNDPMDFIKSELLLGGLEQLKWRFQYLIDMYCYSKAAETISGEYKKKGNELSGNHWKYRIRNYHIYDFIPRYRSFLDNSAYIVASLTNWVILKGNKEYEKRGVIYYKPFRKILKDSISNQRKIGFLTLEDRKKLLEFLDAIDIEKVSSKDDELVGKYRRDITHSAIPGIDHMTQLLVPKFKKENFELESLQIPADPKYKFEDIISLAQKIILIIDEAMGTIFETEIFKSLMKEDEN